MDVDVLGNRCAQLSNKDLESRGLMAKALSHSLCVGWGLTTADYSSQIRSADDAKTSAKTTCGKPTKEQIQRLFDWQLE